MKNNKNNDNKDKKQRIIDAALLLFKQTHDVKKVSIETIAKQAKVSPTTIYNNFGTRENLIYESIKELMKDNIERNRNIINSDIPFPNKIAGVMSSKMDLTANLNSEILEKIIRQDESISPLIGNVYENEIRPLWIKMMSDGKKEGYIDESLNEKVLLIYLDTIKAGLSINKDLWNDFTNKIEIMKQMTSIMFYGFLKKKIDLFNNGGK
jgi:AcrR family transcriptional regulator